MQQAIIDYFDTDRSFKNGVDLYNKLPNRMLSFSRSLSRMNGTTRDIELLHYELWKYTSKPPRLLTITLNQTLKKIIDEDISTFDSSGKSTGFTNIHNSYAKNISDSNGNTDSENHSTGSSSNASNPSLGNADIGVGKGDKEITLTEEAKRSLIKSEIEKSSDLEKASIKIRDQFPFLCQDTCPDEFKILVGDLVTAFHNFKSSRANLFKKTEDKDWYAVANDVQIQYELRKDIFEELDYYQTKGKILGKHSLFVRNSTKEKLRNLGTVKLSVRLTTLEGNIRRNKSKLLKQKGKQAKNTQQRIDEQQWELDFVKVLLNHR